MLAVLFMPFERGRAGDRESGGDVDGPSVSGCLHAAHTVAVRPFADAQRAHCSGSIRAGRTRYISDVPPRAIYAATNSATEENISPATTQYLPVDSRMRLCLRGSVPPGVGMRRRVDKTSCPGSVSLVRTIKSPGCAPLWVRMASHRPRVMDP